MSEWQYKVAMYEPSTFDDLYNAVIDDYRAALTICSVNRKAYHDCKCVGVYCGKDKTTTLTELLANK